MHDLRSKINAGQFASVENTLYNGTFYGVYATKKIRPTLPVFSEDRGMTRWSLPVVVLLVCCPWLTAGEFNPVVEIGQQLAPWKDLPGTDGKQHSWEDVRQRKAVVVFFTSNGCPYAVDYEPRISDLAKQFADNDQVALIGVNSNLIPEDSLEAMADRAAKVGFTFPYLKDEKQALGKAWGAVRTPEFFVLDANREVVYMGALDDNPNAEKATVNYVQEAVEAVLAGQKPEVQETPPIGCTIRYKRTRR